MHVFIAKKGSNQVRAVRINIKVRAAVHRCRYTEPHFALGKGELLRVQLQVGQTIEFTMLIHRSGSMLAAAIITCSHLLSPAIITCRLHLQCTCVISTCVIGCCKAEKTEDMLHNITQIVCCLPQVSSVVHVYGHSHMNADLQLPTAAALNMIQHAGSSSSRRYVQYALDAVGAESAGLYCLWEGGKLAAPGMIVPVTGP
jgi:hypothetical protein